MIRIRYAMVACVVALALLSIYPVKAEPNLDNGRFVVSGGFDVQAAGRGWACIQCHGLNGIGDAAAGFPRLAGQSAWYLYKSLKDYASGRRPNEIMTPIAQALTDDQTEDVAAYYAVQEAPHPPPPDADPQLLQHGGALSAVGSARRGIQACVSCHGAAGIGLPPSVPMLAGQYANYLELQLRLWQQDVRKSDPLAVMEIIAKQMNDEDIRATSLYFASVRPEQAAAQARRAPQRAGDFLPEQPAGSPPALGIVPGPGQLTPPR